MKTTKRFDNAVTKLYKAFHNGTLDAMDCKHCAVGNLCDNSSDWANNGGRIGQRKPSSESISMTGYSSKEINNIEYQFIYGSNSILHSVGDMYLFSNSISKNDVEQGIYSKEEQKTLQFKGLEAVVKYLCKLDGIPNVMDYTSLFEFDKNHKPKKQLQL